MIASGEWRTGFQICLEFKPGFLSLTEAERLARSMSVAISEILSKPEQPTSEISLLGDNDLETIWGWNQAVPVPIERCIHELFSERAKMQPDAPAICACDG